MKVAPERVEIVIPMTATERERTQGHDDHWRVELTDGFRSLVKAMEEDSWPLT